MRQDKEFVENVLLDTSVLQEPLLLEHLPVELENTAQLVLTRRPTVLKELIIPTRRGELSPTVLTVIQEAIVTLQESVQLLDFVLQDTTVP
jgi:hypothetical protein